MVKLHIKKGDESQFLYETIVDSPVDAVTEEVATIYNGRLKIQRICAGTIFYMFIVVHLQRSF